MTLAGLMEEKAKAGKSRKAQGMKTSHTGKAIENKGGNQCFPTEKRWW